MAVKTGRFVAKGKRARGGRGSVTSFSLCEITGWSSYGDLAAMLRVMVDLGEVDAEGAGVFVASGAGTRLVMNS